MYHVYCNLSINIIKTPAVECGGGNLKLLLFSIEFFSIIHAAQPVPKGNTNHDTERETESEPETERRCEAKAKPEAEGDEATDDGGMKRNGPKDEAARNTKQQREKHQVDFAEAGKEAARKPAHNAEDEADERAEHEPDLRRGFFALFKKLTLLAHRSLLWEAGFSEEKAFFKEHS